MIRNTDEALSGLKNGDRATIARCMDQNFALRREIYGDAVVGAQNVATAELCREHGLAAKFTGSGGAFICMRRDGSGW